MTVLNTVMNRTFDVLLFPFRHLPPIVGLSVVSLVTAVALLFVYRATSNQLQLAGVKRRIAAALFEIRLFNDDLPAVFRAQGELLRHNATYLRLSMVPMLWMLVPVALLVAQLEFRYGYTGLTPGEPALLKVTLRAAAVPSSSAAAALDAPPQVHVLTAPIWFPGSKEVIWRIRPDAAGEYELGARIGGETYTKSVEAGDAVVRRSPERVTGGLVSELTSPAERPIPKGGLVESISVRYPPRAIRIFGWDCHWLLFFFISSTVFALLLKKPMGVTV